MRHKPGRPTLLAPLPPRLLYAWQAELTGTGVDARAHWWAMPHWVPRRKLTGAAPSHHELLADTVRHIAGELDASFGGVEMWVQKRAASAAMHLHWDMDEERVRCATVQQASPPPALPATLLLAATHRVQVAPAAVHPAGEHRRLPG